MSVNHSARSGVKIVISFRFSLNAVYCMLSLESPNQGDSNEHTQYTIFNIKNENRPKLFISAFLGCSSRVSSTSSKQLLLYANERFEVNIGPRIV